jgi:hypothetical protein
MPSSAVRSRLLLWLVAGVVALLGAGLSGTAMAQNDWQYPDPYFGILEFEKSHSGTVKRRPRSEVSTGTRARPTFSRPGLLRARRPPTATPQR